MAMMMIRFKKIASIISFLNKANFNPSISSASFTSASKHLEGKPANDEDDNRSKVNETIDYVKDISAEMGGNAKDSMIQGKLNTKGNSVRMKEKAYEMGGNPKDSMGEGKEIAKDNASVKIENVKENAFYMKENTQDETQNTTKDVTNKATSSMAKGAKGAKDKVVGTMEEAKKTVEGYVGGVLRPAEEHRDKDVDQTEFDVERRPLEKKYP